MYDKNNIFAKINSGQLPANKLYEDEYCFAINDINPAAPIHILIIPKGAYENYEGFIAKASDAELLGYFKAIKAIRDQHVTGDFRLVSNNGRGAGQSVFHFHTHLIAGMEFSAIIDKNL